ncbi:hypothetical protein OWR29_36495 [Actinoplanes sp. Pm04-4]|uniref:Uncharacterized protein n=1 Tax=Paractinoplanes pyxinae TaxID=2997416 RepID=A0ABT4BAL6_9ACTN|nr:hypothetical protein [Actinoplanes pyxinae]MCY1143531.1 hypothetical protein [Actinoplanes pyxinae]
MLVDDARVSFDDARTLLEVARVPPVVERVLVDDARVSFDDARMLLEVARVPLEVVIA